MVKLFGCRLNVGSEILAPMVEALVGLWAVDLSTEPRVLLVQGRGQVTVGPVLLAQPFIALRICPSNHDAFMDQGFRASARRMAAKASSNRPSSRKTMAML